MVIQEARIVVDVLTLKEEVDVVDRLHADVSDMRDPWRRKLFSLPYPDSAC